MAMTTPAMPAAGVASRPQTLDERAEMLHSEYGRIRDTIRRTRTLALRHMGPYFKVQVLHEPPIARFHPISHEDTDQVAVAGSLTHIAANYWHSLLFAPEEEIPKAVKEALMKFGITDPSHSDIVIFHKHCEITQIEKWQNFYVGYGC